MASVATTFGTVKEASNLTLQCPMLTSTNYTTWAIKMEAVMDAQGLWDAVEPPLGIAIDEKKSKLARAFIFQAIPEEILLQVAKKKTAREVWESLKLRYLGADRVQKALLHTLKSEFEALRMKETETIDEYAGKLSRMISRHSSLGEVLEDAKLVRKLFDTVPDQFLQLVASMEQYSDIDTMPFEEAIGRWKAYEDRLKLRQSSSGGENMLLLSKTEGRFSQRGRGNSYSNRGRGTANLASSVPRGTVSERGGRFGTRGRGVGRGRGGRWNGNYHSHHDSNGMNRKPRDKRQVDEVNLAEKQDEEPALLLSVCGEDEAPRMVLLNEEKVHPVKHERQTADNRDEWYLDNGASNHMTGVKEMFAELDEGVAGQVYYIPALNSNIVSLGQLTEAGYTVCMKDEFLRLHDQYQRLVMKELVTGMPVIQHPAQICEGCLVAKQIRKPFPTEAQWRAGTPLELVHADLCGPITPKTIGGNQYYMLIVDDYSRHMWVYMLKTNDETLVAFKRFKAQVEKEGTNKVKTLRTDRGGEFNSHEFAIFCDDEGIKRHLTAPYSPQQNGGEAVRHVVYLLNIVTTKAVKNRTPYEGWKGCKPNLCFVKVFGCVAHVKLLKHHVTKLSDRSCKMVHFGIEEGNKAYRLYDPVKEFVVVARDVVFDERRMWPWDMKHGAESQGVGEFVNTTYIFNQSQNDEEEPQNDNQSDAGNSVPNLSHNLFESPSNSGTQGVNVTPVSSSNVASNSLQATNGSDSLLLVDDEPSSYKEAVEDEEWKAAMRTEMESIENNGTWKLVELPKGQKAIGLKWVFKVKKDGNGEISKYKARIVAKGYVQQKGVDFDEVFAPVAQLETIRLILALAAKEGWFVHLLDVKSAFLNGELEEEVFVSQPDGFVVKEKEKMVYRLVKSLYGLRQAPRAWNVKLDQVLKSIGFNRCSHEPMVYRLNKRDVTLTVAVYVYDLLVTGSNERKFKQFKGEMKKIFEMSDLGKLSYYLGIEVE
ncbi:hypothetical protein E3N88_34353 [Mikania micrantha]|uniref:Integrase catalytic domain-containing protein n=1 Tax=Mikania micrantha TaxID=192012 RepID=A0A5N6M0J0_9ASTR|nr:hypothetical protein E3N88_34353 [Mikania micrantha]